AIARWPTSAMRVARRRRSSISSAHRPDTSTISGMLSSVVGLMLPSAMGERSMGLPMSSHCASDLEAGVAGDIARRCSAQAGGHAKKLDPLATLPAPAPLSGSGALRHPAAPSDGDSWLLPQVAMTAIDDPRERPGGRI